MQPTKPMMPGKGLTAAAPPPPPPAKTSSPPKGVAVPPKYGKSNLDALLQAAEAANAGRTRFAPKDVGEKLIRILPPRAGEEYGFRSFGIHYNPSLLPACIELSDRQSVLCVKLTYGEECPLCKIVDRLYTRARASANALVKQQLLSLAGKGKARQRFVVNVVSYDQPTRGVLTWEVNEEVFGVLGMLFKRHGAIDDPVEGQVLSVTYKKKGDFTIPGDPAVTGDHTEIPVKGWEGQLHDLDAYVQNRFMDPSEMKQLIRETLGKPAAPVAEPEPVIEPIEEPTADTSEVDELIESLGDV